MSEFYAEAAAVVDEMLSEYGADLALTKVTTGEYDPDIGGGSQTSTTYAGVGLRETYRNRDIDGSRIKAGDVKLLIAPTLKAGGAMPAPLPQDTILFAGSTYTVQNCDPWDYAGVVVGFSVQARK